MAAARDAEASSVLDVFVAAIRDAAVTGRGVVRVVYSAYQNGYQETTC